MEDSSGERITHSVSSDSSDSTSEEYSTPPQKSKLLTFDATDMRHLHGKMSIPYAPIKDNFESEEVVQFLLNPPSYIICAETPSLCQSNAIFVIDRDRLKHEEDMKSDDFCW